MDGYSSGGSRRGVSVGCIERLATVVDIIDGDVALPEMDCVVLMKTAHRSEPFVQVLNLLGAGLAAVKNGRVFQLRGMKRTGCGEVFGFGNKSARV